MIQFNCDKCDLEIEVDDALAGAKHECLACGDINRVPSVSSDESIVDQSESIDSKKVDRAAKAGYPPDFGPETQVLKVRRCWFRSRVIRFSIAILAVLVGIVGMIWVMWSDRSLVWMGLFTPSTIIGAGLLIWWWIDRFSASLEITSKRTIMHHGILSKSSSEVVHDNIRNIQIDQSFLQRVMRVGKIGISSSGQDGVELQVNHLQDPDKIREIIDLYRPL
ncbi:MAG: PH domain-containing protein [Phycisphaerales bacterium]|nr:PH domain-containing protein [Phycisphaerales bacterium]